MRVCNCGDLALLAAVAACMGIGGGYFFVRLFNLWRETIRVARLPKRLVPRAELEARGIVRLAPDEGISWHDEPPDQAAAQRWGYTGFRCASCGSLRTRNPRGLPFMGTPPAVECAGCGMWSATHG